MSCMSCPLPVVNQLSRVQNPEDLSCLYRQASQQVLPLRYRSIKGLGETHNTRGHPSGQLLPEQSVHLK
jgi:hypothetical protein